MSDGSTVTVEDRMRMVVGVAERRLLRNVLVETVEVAVRSRVHVFVHVLPGRTHGRILAASPKLGSIRVELGAGGRRRIVKVQTVVGRRAELDLLVVACVCDLKRQLLGKGKIKKKD